MGPQTILAGKGYVESDGYEMDLDRLADIASRYEFPEPSFVLEVSLVDIA